MSVRRVVPNIKSEHYAKSREFYCSLLGFEVAMDLGWIMTFVSPSDRQAQLSVLTEDATAPVHPDVSVEVDDVDAVHAEAVRRGMTILHPLTDELWGVRRFFVRDPDGYVVNVLSHQGSRAT